MANYYEIDNISNFVLNKRLDGVYTDCKVTGLKQLDFCGSGYTVAFTLSLKDRKKRYKGKRLKVLTVMNWFDFHELDFTNESLTEYFDMLLGI